jgi:hypothetical protein
LSIRRLSVAWSFLYLAVRNVFALIVLLGGTDRSNELEILVLRHELAVLRRQSRRTPYAVGSRRHRGRLAPVLVREDVPRVLRRTSFEKRGRKTRIQRVSPTASDTGR